MGLRVLSLFDGISCGQIALERAGIKVDEYYASEIKKNAIITTQKHYPNTIQIGDVTKISYNNGVLHTEKGDFEIGKIDLMIGGSPCQDFSDLHRSNEKLNGKTKGLEGNKSGLFYEWLRIREEVKPTYWLLENVRMKKSDRLKINSMVGVEGLFINSDLVSFQKRPRYYWTNIPKVLPPEDRHVNFNDYIDYNKERQAEAAPNATPNRIKLWNNGENTSNKLKQWANLSRIDKVGCISTKQDKSPNSGAYPYKGFCRFLTRREMELAQTLPVGYCDHLSYNQACNVIGDGWTVDVIAHIFSFIPKEEC